MDTITIIADTALLPLDHFMVFDNDTIIHKVVTNSSSADKAFKWTDYLKPSIELLIAIIGAFTLIWTYLRQKKKEFDEKISKQKREAYNEFLTNFTETAVQIMYEQEVEGIQADKERMLARDKLLLFANDAVIKKYHEWIVFADQDEKNIDKEVEIFGELLIEIRKDILGKSKVTKEQISNLNPFNRG